MKKIIEIIKRNKKKAIPVLAGSTILILAGIVWAATNPQAWNTGYRLWNSNRITASRYGSDNDLSTSSTDYCTVIKNTGSKSYFVPTRKLSEFNAFRNNHPSDVDVCCESSTCINYGQNATAVMHDSGINVIQCIERPGCCIIREDDPSLINETAGFFDAVRHGDGGIKWNNLCEVEGNVVCENGPTCDCECRRQLGTNDLYCADSTGTIPPRTCRVRSGAGEVTPVGDGTTIVPLGDWPECQASNGANCSPIW